MQRLAIRFTGRVQGVGFRMTAKSLAQELGLTGWVRNESDGSVSMEAQGTREALDACLAQIPLRTHGRVDRVTTNQLAVLGGETGFEIRA